MKHQDNIISNYYEHRFKILAEKIVPKNVPDKKKDYSKLRKENYRKFLKCNYSNYNSWKKEKRP